MKPGPWLTATSNKHQATSNKLQQIVARQNVALTDKPESRFKRQASSVKLQATSNSKNFRCREIPEALVHASGLRIPGSGSLYLHKVLER